MAKGRVRRRLSGIGMPVAERCWTRIRAAVTGRKDWTAGNMGAWETIAVGFDGRAHSAW